MRSDTLTQPTDQMRQAMAAAEVGDDVYGEDPTINKLEQVAAERVGKEAAVFVPTGSMGNLAAVMAHTQRGDALILEAESHIYHLEVGAISSVAGLLPKLIPTGHGAISGKQLQAAISLGFPRTSLVCLENTHNRHGGTVLTEAEMAEVAATAWGAGIKVHLDGARVFNAAAALGTDVRNLVRHVDSVMFCISKGMSAPVGSLVCGSKEFVAKARNMRKALGGGMRQAGVLAAAGLVAMDTMVDRLADDNARAARLAKAIHAMGGLGVDPGRVQSNIVAVSGVPLGIDHVTLMRELAERGIKGNGRAPSIVRLVVNRHHDDAAIDHVIGAVRDLNAKYGR
jgi:threonine aldolase